MQPHRWASFYNIHHTTTILPNTITVIYRTLYRVKLTHPIFSVCETPTVNRVLEHYGGFHTIFTVTSTRILSHLHFRKQTLLSIWHGVYIRRTFQCHRNWVYVVSTLVDSESKEYWMATTWWVMSCQARMHTKLFIVDGISAWQRFHTIQK